jgi:hypothetical protein
MRLLAIAILLTLGVSGSSAWAQATDKQAAADQGAANQGTSGQGAAQGQGNSARRSTGRQSRRSVSPPPDPAEIHRCAAHKKHLNAAARSACT